MMMMMTTTTLQGAARRRWFETLRRHLFSLVLLVLFFLPFSGLPRQRSSFSWKTQGFLFPSGPEGQRRPDEWIALHAGEQARTIGGQRKKKNDTKKQTYAKDARERSLNENPRGAAHSVAPNTRKAPRDDSLMMNRAGLLGPHISFFFYQSKPCIWRTAFPIWNWILMSYKSSQKGCSCFK